MKKHIIAHDQRMDGIYVAFAKFHYATFASVQMKTPIRQHCKEKFIKAFGII